MLRLQLILRDLVLKESRFCKRWVGHAKLLHRKLIDLIMSHQMVTYLHLLFGSEQNSMDLSNLNADMLAAIRNSKGELVHVLLGPHRASQQRRMSLLVLTLAFRLAVATERGTLPREHTVTARNVTETRRLDYSCSFLKSRHGQYCGWHKDGTLKYWTYCKCGQKCIQGCHYNGIHTCACACALAHGQVASCPVPGPPPTTSTTTPLSCSGHGRRLGLTAAVGKFFVSTVVAWGVDKGLDGLAEAWFDEDVPSQSTGSCVPYPSGLAEFCGKRQSHRLPCAFADSNLIKARDLIAHNLYLLLRYEGNLSVLLDSHPVCDRSVQDAICLDALPMCYCADMTACLMACNNVRDCAIETGQTLPPELEADGDCATKCRVLHPELPCVSSETVNRALRKSRLLVLPALLLTLVLI